MPLNIIATDNNPTSNTPLTRTGQKATQKATKRITAKAILDRLYLIDPDQFDPRIECMGRERFEKTIHLINEFLNGNEKCAADLGTGSGIFATHLSELGITVHAVDIATSPLKKIAAQNDQKITTFQDYIPHTTLESDFYDLVLGLDVIAYLSKDEYRLFFAELSRLVNVNGFVAISTPIDIDSEDALQGFFELAEMEFNSKRWLISHHAYFIRLCRFFEAPAIFAKASKDQICYEKELHKRYSINRLLFKFNSSKIPAFFWTLVKCISNPILNFIKQNRFILLNLEKICRFFSSDTGISHAIFIGTRKKVFDPETNLEKSQRFKKALS